MKADPNGAGIDLWPIERLDTASPEMVRAAVVWAAGLIARAAARGMVEAANPTIAPPSLLTAKQVAARLGVGVDWVRDHGAELGEVRLSAGTVRYNPTAVDRVAEAYG